MTARHWWFAWGHSIQGNIVWQRCPSGGSHCPMFWRVPHVLAVRKPRRPPSQVPPPAKGRKVK